MQRSNNNTGCLILAGALLCAFTTSMATYAYLDNRDPYFKPALRASLFGGLAVGTTLYPFLYSKLIDERKGAILLQTSSLLYAMAIISSAAGNGIQAMAGLRRMAFGKQLGYTALGIGTYMLAISAGALCVCMYKACRKRNETSANFVTSSRVEDVTEKQTQTPLLTKMEEGAGQLKEPDAREVTRN